MYKSQIVKRNPHGSQVLEYLSMYFPNFHTLKHIFVIISGKVNFSLIWNSELRTNQLEKKLPFWISVALEGEPRMINDIF